MISIIISETVDNKEDAPFLLRHIAIMVEQGYTSGHAPAWEIIED